LGWLESLSPDETYAFPHSRAKVRQFLWLNNSKQGANAYPTITWDLTELHVFQVP